ncbi:MAG: hypothetical protein PVSMB1_06300 [Gemmatimonadaceae bacterium]
MGDDTRLDALEAKVRELEAMLKLAMRLLAMERPVSALLESYGATEVEDLAVHELIDSLATRAEQGGMYAPSFGGFINELYARFPAVRDNREFVGLLIDTWKVDRPVYRQLHTYVVANGWPQWP